MFKTLIKVTKRLLLLAVLLLAAVLGAWFASENPSKITPVFLGFTMKPYSLGVYLCLAIGIGVFMGAALSFLMSRKALFLARQNLRRKDTKIKQLEALQAKGPSA